MRKILLCLLALGLVGIIVGCDDINSDSGGGKAVKDESSFTRSTRDAYMKNMGMPDMGGFSLEWENHKKRAERNNDPNRVGYVYLISDGLIVANYVIKGKVSAVSSQLTNPTQAVDCGSGCAAVIDQAGPSGTYDRPGGGGIFFFTDKGAYVQWGGDYIWSDQPLNLSQPAVLQVER